MNEEAATERSGYRDRDLVVADGLRLHFRDYPGSERRPPLLCLPGLTRNARDFAEFAERHSPRFRVIALDFRGRGGSDFDPQPSRYHARTYAGDVLALLDELGIGEAIFVGTSLGGLVTMIVAALAPGRIVAAILNDVGPELRPEGLERIKSYVGKDIRFKSWDEAAAAIASNNGQVPASYSDADWLAAARRSCREQDGEIRFDYDMAIAELFHAPTPAPPVDMWPLFAALAERPLLVVRGERSDLLSAAAAERMRLEAPDASLVAVPGAGHPPTLGEPEAAAAIDAFLEKVAP